MDGRALLASSGKFNAGSSRRWIGHMLDRLRADLAWNAGRKSSAETSGSLCASRADHRRASEIRTTTNSKKRAGNSLDRAVINPAIRSSFDC